MGLESAVYSLVPDRNADSVERGLEQLGAVPTDKPSPLSFPQWVLRDQGALIDLMAVTPKDGSRAALSVRVAVSNPPSVEGALRILLVQLLDHFGGKVRDWQTHRSYERLDDAAWDEIRGAFLEKKSVFRRYRSELEAPVSGDEVS
jgi:hypothetical protein